MKHKIERILKVLDEEVERQTPLVEEMKTDLADKALAPKEYQALRDRYNRTRGEMRATEAILKRIKNSLVVEYPYGLPSIQQH